MKLDINELVADYVKAEIVGTDLAPHTNLVDCLQEQSIGLLKEIDYFASSVDNAFSQVEMVRTIMESLEKVLREGWETCHPEDATLHYNEGYSDGREEGYNEGYDDAYEESEDRTQWVI